MKVNIYIIIYCDLDRGCDKNKSTDFWRLLSPPNQWPSLGVGPQLSSKRAQANGKNVRLAENSVRQSETQGM